MIPLLQTKTADTAHMGIFASDIRPLSRFLGGAWGRGYVCTVVLRKRAHGRYTLLCAQTRGWADTCNITAFYHEKAFWRGTTQLHAKLPTSGSVLTSQEKDSKFHASLILLANLVM